MKPSEQMAGRQFHFEISLPDETRDVVVTVEAETENEAWDKLPREVEKQYEGRRWYYNNRFRIVENNAAGNADAVGKKTKTK